MGNLRKKAKDNLDRRLNAWNEESRKHGESWIKANKKPGSLKYKR